MNKKGSARRFSSPLTRSILSRYLLVLFLAIIGFIVLALLCQYVFAAFFVWQEDNPLYQLMTALNRRFPEILILACVGIFLTVTLVFMWLPLHYLDTVVGASEQLLQAGDAPIQLPAALKSVEDRMNLIRQTSRQNAYAAREAEQRKNDLIVYLAHDLKTPLTSVIGYLTLLRDEPQISPELRAKYTGVALDKALRLEELTNEFFDITRFNLTQIFLEKEPVDLVRMLQQIASEFEPALSEKGLHCVLELPPSMEYECDPDKMARVFDNLLRNAQNYSFPDSAIHISGSQSASGILLQFENSGKTIPPEKLSRIFEQFFRLDASRGSQSGGAGLGLAIAKEIVGLHGGALTAESAENQIRFTVCLPLPQPLPAGKDKG